MQTPAMKPPFPLSVAAGLESSEAAPRRTAGAGKA
jgi:hypothetical protein